MLVYGSGISRVNAMLYLASTTDVDIEQKSYRSPDHAQLDWQYIMVLIEYQSEPNYIFRSVHGSSH